MNSTDFTLNIIAALNKQLSKKQLKNDLKSMDNSMSVKVLAKLTTALSKKQLASSLKQINNLYVQVGTKLKTDNSTKKNIMSEIGQLQKNLSELQMKVGIDKAASANTIKSVVSTAKTAQQYADKTSITLNLEAHKEKAINDILYIGQKYSKLFSNISASKKYENLLNSAYSISDKSQLQEVRAKISAFTSELKIHGLAVESTGDKWRKLIDRAKDLFSAATLIKVAFTQVKQAISTTLDLDKVYTDLVKVNSELERKDYAEYLSRINQKAKELATTQKGLIEGATEFSKSGFNLATSDKLSQKSTILANVGDMSDADAAKAIISGVQAYDIVDGYDDVIDKAGALIDKYNEIGNTASITTAEIAQGVQKVGSVFADANTSVDQFIALLSAGNRQFQDADNLSLGLRTAALRIRGCSAELEAMGEETDNVYTSTAKLAEKIEGLTNINGTGGVKIFEDDEETFRSIYDIFLDISKVYKEMSDTDQSALLELIAGKNRASAISATLNNMSEAEENLQNSINAAGSAQKEYDAYLQSVEAHIAKFKATLVETYSTLINGDMVLHAADMGTAILNLVNQTDLLKHSVLSILALNIGKGITTVGAAIVSTSQQMNTLGNALQQVKNLSMDDVLRTKPLVEVGEATKNLTEKNLKLLLSQKQLSVEDKILLLTTQGLTKEEAQLKLEKMGLLTATKAQSAANVTEAITTFTLKNAMTSLKASIIGVGTSIKAAFLSNPIGITMMAVTTIISVATTAINKYNQKLEEARQKAIELTNAYKEQKDSLDSQIEKYKELKENLDKGNLSTDETRSIKEQLLEIQKSLIESYGNEASNIDLVNGKYKEQLGLLSELSKEKATDYVKENRSAYEDAKKELEKVRTYKIGSIFSYEGRDGMSDAQKQLYDYIKSYSELFEIRSMYDTSTFSNSDYAPTLFVNANADEAKLLIDQFYDDIEKYIKENNLELDYDSLQIDLSKVSSNIETDDALKEYREIYDEFMKAEVVRNDTLRPLYQQSIKAVEDYNNALSSGEGVAEAKANLDSVKQSVQNATGELEGSQEVFDSIYAGINKSAESAYNLAQSFENDESVKGYAEQLKGLTDMDLKAINFEDNVQSPGEEAFGALIDILGLSEDEAQNLIDKLVELGYVQGKVQSSTLNENPNFSTQLTTSQESLDKFQSSVKSASDAYATLLSGNYSSSELLDSIQTINQAIKDMGGKINWEFINNQTQIDSLELLGMAIESVSKTYAESILSDAGIDADSEFGQMLANIIQETFEAKAQFTEMNAQLDNLQSSYQTLTGILESYNETGYISLDNLQSLLTADENLITMLEVENGQLAINQEAYENLVAVQLMEFKEKLNNAVAAEIEALAKSKAEEATNKNADASNNAVEKLDAETAAFNRNTTAAISNAVAKAEESGVSEDEIQTILDKYNEIWNAAVNNFDGDFDSFMGGTRSASSAGSSAGDAYVNAFEEELKALDELRDNGLISEKEYLDRLRVDINALSYSNVG